MSHSRVDKLAEVGGKVLRVSLKRGVKVILAGCVGALVIFNTSCDFFAPPRQGKTVVETWETTNGTFKVNVTAYAEENGWPVPGAYYVFRSAAAGSDEWCEVMTFRHDDPVAIPRDHIRFVNDRLGYVFMGRTYAVTTDGGSTWSVWDAKKDLPDWQCCNSSFIQDVQMTPEGTGTMKLEPIEQRRGEVPELHTRDYGRHWTTQPRP